MTNTDFILSRLRVTLALQRLIRFGAAQPSADKISCRRLVPVVTVQYTGFNLPIRLLPEARLSWLGRIKRWWGQLRSRFSQRAAVIKVKWADSPWARVLLHCTCLVRHGHVRWHWAGILRELRPLPGCRTLVALSPARRPGQAVGA